MDFTPFKLDIDELLDDFAEGNFTSLADMKNIWMAKKFSYIYEAKPVANFALFMQSLYAHSISHMVSTGSLSRRLGGLFCLYCLYETQPYKPCFKIYLSLGQLKVFKTLVVEAKDNGIGVVPALVKRMLDRNMFLFGFVDIVNGSLTQRVDEITKLLNRQIQIAHDRLLENSQIDTHLHMDLGMELEHETLKKMSTEYEKAKEQALNITEPSDKKLIGDLSEKNQRLIGDMVDASDKVDDGDITSIVKKKKLIGDMVEDIVLEWEVQKDAFYKKTGINRPDPNEIVATDGFDELERLLNE